MENAKLIKTYRMLDYDLAKVHSLLNSTRENKSSLFVPTDANCRIVKEQLNLLKERIDALETPAKPFEFIKNHFNDFFYALNLQFETISSNPQGYLYSLGWKIVPMILDAEDFTAGYDILISRLGAIKDIVSVLEVNCRDEKQKLALSEAIGYMKNNLGVNKVEYRSFYEFLGKEKETALLNLVEETESFLNEKQQILSDGKSEKYAMLDDSAVLPQDIEKYKNALSVNIGVNMDELLQWYEAETEKTRKECFEIARSLDIPENNPQTMADINNILLKYAGPADTADEMYERANSYIKRTRAIAHEYVWLPEDENCIISKVPIQLKVAYPWGGYEGGYRFKTPIVGRMFLNNYNFKAITDGWMKINTLHEAYPGHHVQHVRSITDPIPETMKIGAKNVPLHEGTCLRTERAFEFVFAEDPFYPLFVAYRRHHTSVRIKVDLWLRYFGKTIGDAVDLYQQELGFDRQTARFQVQAHENDEGYFTSYYYGMKKLCEWEKLYGYDKMSYTKLLFSVGGVSLENFKLYLDMTEDEKFMLTHAFGSLYQFD
ncbi:MAG: DUF885 domain-containing protein [Ruminococcaceae bacterium]|nr:DUF885 domain-containing protein [Oscillospiraceae bacterium]